MRKFFDKSPAIDAASNLRLVSMIQNHDEPYTEKEEEILRDGQAQFAVFEAQKGKGLTMPLPAVKAKLAFKAGDSRAFGFVTTTVRARSTRGAAAAVEHGEGAAAAAERQEGSAAACRSTRIADATVEHEEGATAAAD
jgi:hypothetical protein